MWAHRQPLTATHLKDACPKAVLDSTHNSRQQHWPGAATYAGMLPNTPTHTSLLDNSNHTLNMAITHLLGEACQLDCNHASQPLRAARHLTPPSGYDA
jgi:hypothetical protein